MLYKLNFTLFVYMNSIMPHFLFHISHIEFTLGDVSRTTCNKPDGIDEGIELAVRSMKHSDWIPLAYYVESTGRFEWKLSVQQRIPITQTSEHSGTVNIRGYTVPLIQYASDGSVQYTVKACGEVVNSTDVQFRWLQTASFSTGDRLKDSWYLDDVRITFQDGNYSQKCLYSQFDSAKYVNIANTLIYSCWCIYHIFGDTLAIYFVYDYSTN